jgi:hypothetical protein
MDGFRHSDLSPHQSLWATASTANVTFCQCFDPYGFATGIRLITGQKYWVSFRRKINASSNDMNGDLRSIQTSVLQGKGFSWISKGLPDHFDAEALLLEEGMAM